MADRRWGGLLRVARRELAIVARSRGAVTGLLLVAAVAWLPPVLLPLRAGSLGLASFAEILPLTVAAEGVVLPLVALLLGAEMVAGEAESGSLASLVTLPLSRTTCFLGKLVGRVAALVVATAALFAVGALAVALATGADGVARYVAVQGSALLLLAVCVSIGGAVAAGGRGRVHAYAVTLLTWVALVFLVDAVLLAGIVALAPPAPETVGEHGHSELSAAMPMPASASEQEAGSPAPTGVWLLTLDPVDLFRLGALAVEDGADASASGPGPTLPLTVGWLGWLLAPTLLGLRRFRGAALR